MSIEKSSTNIIVDNLSNFSHQDFNALLLIFTVFTLTDNLVMQSQEIKKRILIHWVNTGKISDNKIKY